MGDGLVRVAAQMLDISNEPACTNLKPVPGLGLDAVIARVDREGGNSMGSIDITGPDGSPDQAMAPVDEPVVHMDDRLTIQHVAADVCRKVGGHVVGLTAVPHQETYAVGQ